MQELHDALALQDCGSVFDATAFADVTPRRSELPDNTEASIFVDAAAGDDDFGVMGREDRPFKTLHAAVEHARKYHANKPEAMVTVVLRGGRHYLSGTLELSADDSYTSFIGYPEEDAVITGAKKLQTDWKPFKTDGSSNIYVADLSGQVTSMPGLRVNGKRGVRARLVLTLLL